ncbi:MAG: hypothetical protein HY744_31770 [Deltaproteobacteria bacterium]|nr:hypothetical protein [Deltaproteobacteria bacterium]
MRDAARLPSGWTLATLGVIADLKGGVTKGQRYGAAEKLTTVPYLRVANVQRGHLDLSSVTEIAVPVQRVAELRLVPGDVLFTEGGDRDKLGRGWVWQGELPLCIHQNHVFRARIRGQTILPKLLSWYGNTMGQAYFLEHGKQTTNLASVNMTKLGELPVLIPPAKEQAKIVDEVETQLSRIDAGVAALERVQANLKRYRASVLKAAVEGRLVSTEAELARAEGRDYEPADKLLGRILKERRARWEAAALAKMKAKGKPPTDDRWKAKYIEPEPPDTSGLPELPEGWGAATLEQITSAVRVICYGILMPKEHVPDGVLYVKVKDLRGDRLDVSTLSRTHPTIAAKYDRASLAAGDLLLAIRGTYGRVAEVPPELDGGNITQDTARLAVLLPLDRRFVAASLRSPTTQRYFARVARGVAVKGVNIGDVRPTVVLVAPLAEQRRIVDEVERQLSAINEIEQAIGTSRRRSAHMRQAILRHAFEGKLVPQDPNDEPAALALDAGGKTPRNCARVRVDKKARKP